MLISIKSMYHETYNIKMHKTGINFCQKFTGIVLWKNKIIIKGMMSPIFSITLKSHKMYAVVHIFVWFELIADLLSL